MKPNGPPVVRADLLVPIENFYLDASKVQIVEPPMNYGPCAITPQLWGVMQSAEAFSIRQHVKLLPKTCCSCPPCVKQENTYSIYAGLNQSSEHEILRADEVRPYNMISTFLFFVVLI